MGFTLSLTMLTLSIFLISSSLMLLRAALSAHIEPLREHGSELTPVTVFIPPLWSSYLMVAATLNEDSPGFGDLTR